MVSVILDNLAAGVPREEIIGSYPSIREVELNVLGHLGNRDWNAVQSCVRAAFAF